jgi:hypothetical protein
MNGLSLPPNVSLHVVSGGDDDIVQTHAVDIAASSCNISHLNSGHDQARLRPPEHVQYDTSMIVSLEDPAGLGLPQRKSTGRRQWFPPL